MIERLRRAFNASWTPSQYEAYKARLAADAGAPIHFRVCETPVYLPPELRDAMVQGALEIWDLLLQPEALERSKAAVPKAYDVPGCDAHPLFAVADFAIVDDFGRLVPRLIELQGFPSLYGFQLLQARLCRAMIPGEPLDFLLGGLDEAGYLEVVGERDQGRPAGRERGAARPRPAQAGDLPGLRRHREAVRRTGSLPDRRPEARPRAVVRAGRSRHAHPAHLQPHDRGRARREERRAAVPAHGRARRAVGGTPQLVLPLEQARAAGPAAPARTRSAPRSPSSTACPTTSSAGC